MEFSRLPSCWSESPRDSLIALGRLKTILTMTVLCVACVIARWKCSSASTPYERAATTLSNGGQCRHEMLYVLSVILIAARPTACVYTTMWISQTSPRRSLWPFLAK